MNEDGEIRLSSISKADSYEAIGEFWDTHSLADYWDQGHDVEIEVNIPRRHRVAIEAETFERIAVESRQRGILPETLINMWLAERLQALQVGAEAKRGRRRVRAVAESQTDRITSRDEVPKEFATLKEAGQFWDVHDSGDYEDLMVPVELEMDGSTDRIYMAIAKDVAEQLRTKAREQGVSAETLVNLWLQEQLLQSA